VAGHITDRYRATASTKSERQGRQSTDTVEKLVGWILLEKISETCTHHFVMYDLIEMDHAHIVAAT